VILLSLQVCIQSCVRWTFDKSSKLKLITLLWFGKFAERYLSNRPQVFMVYRPINHAECWKNTWRIRKSDNNWHRLVSANQWPINNHTKTVHWLLSIGSATSKRHHARYLSDHPPFLGSPGDAIWPSLLNAKNITCCTCTQITHLPIIAFPCHNVYVRRMGRGFTEYKVHRQRLSSLPFWGERWWSVNCKQEEGGTRKCV